MTLWILGWATEDAPMSIDIRLRCVPSPVTSGQNVCLNTHNISISASGNRRATVGCNLGLFWQPFFARLAKRSPWDCTGARQIPRLQCRSPKRAAAGAFFCFLSLHLVNWICFPAVGKSQSFFPFRFLWVAQTLTRAALLEEQRDWMVIVKALTASVWQWQTLQPLCLRVCGVGKVDCKQINSVFIV